MKSKHSFEGFDLKELKKRNEE